MELPLSELSLRRLPWAGRLGLTLLLCTVGLGLATSVTHLFHHYENRDEQPGLTLDDLRGAYHGIRSSAPLVTALESGHPEGLPAADRTALLQWLSGDRVSDDYDNLELGEAAPAEILDVRCLSCHARDAGDPIGKRVPLEYWDDVAKLSISRDITPTATEIVVASAHTHALGMGTLSLLLAALGLATRWSRGLVGLLTLTSGAGLLLDLSGWFLARYAISVVPLMAGAGALWLASSVGLIVLILLELWLPRK
ncbi:MAG: hypothetical protein AAF628_36150 [Planctomycetota bacterium]